MTVVCSGFLMYEAVDPRDDRKKVMTFEPEKKVSVQNLGFAVGPFEHVDLSSEFRAEEDEVKLGVSALKIHAYCLPGRADWVRNTAAALTMAADFLTYTFARYPFGSFKLCFLDDMVDDTVALHSLAFISNRLLYPDDVPDLETDVTRKIALTLTHQWIGINMIPNTRNDLWLVLGVAHYMTDLFIKKLCGNNEHRFRVKAASDRLVAADVGRPSLWELGPYLHLGPSQADFMALKAPVVVLILDKRLAKASGGHGLTRILQKLLTKAQVESSDRSVILDTEKFRATCEKGARTRLEAFWNQWVYGVGCPRFDVKAKFNKKRLCVELTLNQVQHQAAATAKADMDKGDFLRAVKERRAGLAPGAVQPLFTGPMTIRIHEADGTPYEHILEIREDATRSTKFEIPYNTKYKRLKRTRRLKEKQNADVADNADDALLYSLGDVLQGPDDLRDWELIEWDPETERKMDQESYEWIRIDADFEWACDMKRNLEPYMYVSQLQQDRDVVAQQDAMLYLGQGPLHPIASGFLVRTLVDRRYFHGIRAMAARALTRQANIKDIPMLGLRQLLRAFRDMFCYGQTNQPRPNDFSDKRQYKVRCAIVEAVAGVRDGHTHRCPPEARRFILDQLLFNNNEGNPYSDHFYIATLVGALATSLIPSQRDDWCARQTKAPADDDERRFLDEALEQIERVLRRDEWTNSFQNVWTVAGLDAKRRLMEADVIPTQYTDFAQYVLDGTRDLVRVKALEALVDLGALMEPTFFSFFLYALTTDRSPYVRDKLVQSMARGLAAIAFGEHAGAARGEPAAADEADPLLLVQDSAQEIEARKAMFARRENLDAALKALRKEMEETYARDERHYSTAMRKALDHPGLGRAELESLLDLAAMMFDEARSWVLTLNLPKAWRMERPAQKPTERPRASSSAAARHGGAHAPVSLVVTFKSFYKIKPKEALSPPPAQETRRSIAVPRSSSIKINTKASSTPQRPSILVPHPAWAASPASQPTAAPAPPAPETPFAQSAKRARTEKEEGGTPVPKRPKTESRQAGHEVLKPAKKSHIVTLKTSIPGRLAVVLGQSPPGPAAAGRTALPSGAPKETSPGSAKEGPSAKAARKPLPNGERRPLPGSALASPQAVPPTVKAPAKVSPTPVPAPQAGSPTSVAPASSRPKIKIIRKPLPPPPPPSS